MYFSYDKACCEAAAANFAKFLPQLQRYDEVDDLPSDGLPPQISQKNACQKDSTLNVGKRLLHCKEMCFGSSGRYDVDLKRNEQPFRTIIEGLMSSDCQVHQEEQQIKQGSTDNVPKNLNFLKNILTKTLGSGFKLLNMGAIFCEPGSDGVWCTILYISIVPLYLCFLFQK